MIDVYIINNSFFVLDEKSKNRLSSKNYGRFISDKLELSAYETEYLLEKNKINLIKFPNRNIKDRNYLIKKGYITKHYYVVYKDLKDKGFRVETGLKYGFPFRIYDRKEKHAIRLIEPIFETEFFRIKDLVGKNRIANSTRKKMIFAVVDYENSVTYLEISWKKI